MLYYIFNSDSSVLYKTIVKILKKADDEKYIKQLYLKMMYDVHMLAVDVSNNKNLLEDSSLDVPKTIIETVSNNSDRNIISLFIYLRHNSNLEDFTPFGCQNSRYHLILERIKNDPASCIAFSKYILKNKRWYESEEIIKTNLDLWNLYKIQCTIED